MTTEYHFGQSLIAYPVPAEVAMVISTPIRRPVVGTPPPTAAPTPSARAATRARAAGTLLLSWLAATCVYATRTTPRGARITRNACILGIGLMLPLCLAGIGVLVLQSGPAPLR